MKVGSNCGKNIEELTLLLMYLTSWEEESLYYDENNNLNKDTLKNAWKGYSFETINELTDKGYLFPLNYKNKSVTLTEEGEKLAKELVEKYIKEFEKWLNEKDLADKTIRKHLNNVDLYINDYLNYYEITKVEDGMNCIHSFLDGWFIEKCLWASKNSLKEIAASIKKFYQYMSENNYVSVEDYNEMCSFIKENMYEFLEQVDAFEDGTYYDIF